MNPSTIVMDAGPDPFVFNIEDATKDNTTFRTSLWTGKHLQITVMDIKPGEDIGLERHENWDQFLRVEQGTGVVNMGYSKDNLNLRAPADSSTAIIVPAGVWHNLINTGNQSLKVYSIYSPPAHPWNTIHETKEDAEAAEE